MKVGSMRSSEVLRALSWDLGLYRCTGSNLSGQPLGGDLMCVASRSFWQRALDLESKSSGGKWGPFASGKREKGAVSSDSSSVNGGFCKYPPYWRWEDSKGLGSSVLY